MSHKPNKITLSLVYSVVDGESVADGSKRKQEGWLSAYRQQNVRQRQKLISIIDYDVCILEYLQPFWRYSTSTIYLLRASAYR